MAYLTRKVTIPGYDWTVELYEDTAEEHDALIKAWTEGDWKKRNEILSPLIKSANWTNRDDSPLGTSPDDLSKVPGAVISRIINDYSDQMIKSSDPKVNSASSPISGHSPATGKP